MIEWWNAASGGYKFTTASNTGDYPYQGAAGTKAVIKRGTSCTDAMFKFYEGDITFENIDLDGGWQSDKSGITAENAVLECGWYSADSGTVTLRNVTIKNNNNTVTAGGAINSSGWATNLVLEDVDITNCMANSGGAILLNNSNLTMSDVNISNCYSTNESKRNASAIEDIGGSVEFTRTLDNVSITNCIALNAIEDGSAVSTENYSLWSLSDVTISGNYSKAGNAGFNQYDGMAVLDINGDLIIDNNYPNCTINGYTATHGTKESNLTIDNPSFININTNLTSSSSVGVTTNVTANSQTIFGNAASTITGLDSFFLDIDNTVDRSI